jgi:hypothetical protein
MLVLLCWRGVDGASAVGAFVSGGTVELKV